MAKLINAKCPNCGAILELPANLDRAFCVHCGGKVIIARDETHYHQHESQKIAITCPDCHGRGYFPCQYCNGTGKCAGYIVYSVLFKCMNGWCSQCQGGRVEKYKKRVCNHCGGTGVCSTCGGTGLCNYCRGNCRVPCRTCNGSGFKGYREG